MEKSVLLELIEKRDKSYEDMVRKASIFDITEDVEAKINSIFSKLNDIKNYIENTKVKETTIDKVNAATVESMSVINNADKFLSNTLQKVANELLWEYKVDLIESLLSKNLKKNDKDLKAVEEQKIIAISNKKVVLTSEVKDTLIKFTSKKKLTENEMADLVALRNIIIQKYLNDSNTDSKKRLAAIPFKDEETNTFNGYLDSILEALSSKKNKSAKVVNVAAKEKGTETQTNGNANPSNKADTSTKETGAAQQEQEVRKVKKVTKTTTKVEEKNKKTKGRIAALIAAGIITLGMLISLPFILKGCKNNKNNKPSDTTKEPGIETTTEPVETEAPFVIPTININDETKLEEYAKYLQDELKMQDVDMSIEEIKNAIKLVNVDYLEEKPFDNREQVYNATEDAGKIATKLGTSSVLAEDPTRQENLITERTLDDMMKNVVPTMEKANLNLTKKENGYSIYELLDQLTYILENSNTYSAEDRENAAKLFNEVMARKVRTFTLTPNSSVGQYYLAMGMYEAEHQNVKDLTAGRLYGPMYGDEETIDGSYGFICVEELQKYTRTGNTDNAFYTNYADMMLKDKTLTKSIN